MWLLSVITDGILHDPYVTMNVVTVALLVSFSSGALLFGTAGASLLIGGYSKHKQTFHRLWLILGLLAFFLFLGVFSTVPTP